MKRAVVVQLFLFAAIGVVCAVFVVNTVLGPRAFAAPVEVVVRMPDAAGLAPTSQVTYRGARVGTVADVSIAEDGSETRMRISLDPEVKVPTSVRAVVSMDTPMGVQHLDLQAADDAGPYLRDGSVIRPEKTARPIPLNQVLMHFKELADSIDHRDISVVSDALATGLNGTEPEVNRILDNTEALVGLMERREPQVTNLLEQGPGLLDLTGEAGGDLPELAKSMRELTGDLREQEPALCGLARKSPEVAREVVRLLRENDQATGELLGNMVSAGELMGSRAPALDEAMVAVPQGLGELAGIVHGDIADFYLVGAQGPVCYYDTPRRTAQETGPRELHTEWTCPSGENLQQRGADSAPRPNGSPSTAAPNKYEPTAEQVAGPPESSDGAASATGRNPVLGPRSWHSIMLRGVR